MAPGNEICDQHTGCLSDIKHLQSSDENQWERINSMTDKLNVALGMLVLTLLAAVVNLIVLVKGGG
jgi:hypothetical protein